MRQPWYTTAKIIFVILLAIYVLIVLFVAPVSADIVDGQVFNNRTTLSLLGTSNATDAPYHLIISNTTGTNTTEQLFVKSSILANFNDVRFTGSSGELLKYYLHAKNLTIADFIVKLPVVSTVTPATLNVWYGNQTTPSNISTFSSVVTGLNATATYTQDEDRRYFLSQNLLVEDTVSVAYQDLFGSDTSFRYANASQNTGGALTPAAMTIAGGVLPLASDTAQNLTSRLKSYKFSGGQYEFSFDNNGDGGGGVDFNGLYFGMQDTLNTYKIIVRDDTAGDEDLLIYNTTAGTNFLLNTTDVSAIYTRGQKTWIKFKLEETNGTIYGWIRDNAGAYTDNPQIVGFQTESMNWTLGYVSAYAGVTTAGANNLNTNFDDLTINAELRIGSTNIPDATAPGGFKPILRGAQGGEKVGYWDGTNRVNATAFSDDFNHPTDAEWVLPAGSSIDTTNGKFTFGVAYRGNYPNIGMIGSGTVSSTYRLNGVNYVYLFFAGTSQYTAGSFYDSGSRYNIVMGSVNVRLYYAHSGANDLIQTITRTVSTTTTHAITILYNRTAASFIVYEDGVLLGTFTDSGLTLTNYGYNGLAVDNVAATVYSYDINALESTSTNGVTYTLGGVPHGARYNWTEYAGLQTTPASTPIYLKLIIPSFSTTTMATANNLTITNATSTTVSTFQTGANPMAQNLIGFFTKSIYQPSAGTVTAVVNATNPQIDNRNATFLMPIIIPDYFFGQQTNLTANFTATPSSGYNPLPVQFNDTSYGVGITSWNWTFPDGTYNSTQNPAHLFLTSGNWSVRLIVTGDGGTNVKNLTIRVDDGTPLAMFVPAEAVSIWWPATVTWNSTSTNNPTSYLWEFGDGTNATSSNVTHFYTMPGIYPIKFTATNAAGSTSNMTAVQEMM